MTRAPQLVERTVGDEKLLAWEELARDSLSNRDAVEKHMVEEFASFVVSASLMAHHSS